MDLNDLPETSADIPIEGKKQQRRQIAETVPNEEPQPEEEDKDERFQRIIREQSIKNKILRYKISFGKYLTAYDYKIQDLDQYDAEQLSKLLEEIEICVSCRTSGNMLKSYYIGAVEVAEKCAPLLSMNLTGLSRILGENEQIRECLEEISIKYDVIQHTPPEARLCFLTLQSILAINTHNRKLIETKKILTEPVKKEVVEEFKDL